MASDEDARTAARRIVEQVLASRDEQVLASRDEQVLASRDEQLTTAGSATPDAGAAAGVEELVDDAVQDLAAADEPVSDARVRARALVAEVLAAHEARTADADAPPPPATPDDAPLDDEAPVDHVAPQDDDAPQDEVAPLDEVAPQDEVAPLDETDAAPESTSRLRARELVAAAIAEAEAREAAEREAARRADAEAAEARERDAEAARQLAAALADEAERDLFVDDDRGGTAATTAPMPRHDDEPDAGAGRTAPLSVAELAAAERAARRPDADHRPDGAAERTAVMPVAATVTAVARGRRDDGQPSAATALHEPDHREAVTAAQPPLAEPSAPESVAAETPEVAAPDAAAPDAAALDADGPPALEATVELGDVDDPPRTGRWLLASILGAATLAILFPLAIKALLRLVSLS